MKLAIRSLLFIAAALPLATRLVGQNVVTDWNMIASSTIVAHGGNGPGVSSVWFAYESIAIYDAINSIHREFKPFYYDGRCSRDASSRPGLLLPATAGGTGCKLRRVISETDGNIARQERGRAGGGGFGASFDFRSGGRWSPGGCSVSTRQWPGRLATYSARFLPAATPWLGQMRPFILRSPSQFLPPGPTKLSGEEWAANYNVTRLLGDKISSVRTAGQTEIGLFWTENTSQQYARAFNYLVQYYRLDLMDSARMMAMLWTGAADSIYRLLQRVVHLQLLAAGDGDTSGGRR